MRNVIKLVSRSELGRYVKRDGQRVGVDGVTYVYDLESDELRRADGGRKRTGRTGDHYPGKAPDVEPVAGRQPLASRQNPTFSTRVSIRVVSYRVRLADADGISAKAAIDGAVHCGILRDDDARFVSKVTHEQVKVKNADEEKTELIFTRDRK